MPPKRRRTSYGKWAESRPEGYVCPYRRCGGKRYNQLRHYHAHLRRTHANERVPAPEYRAPDAPEDPPPPKGPDNEQSGTAVPFWDWGPSQRHSKSIRLLDGDDLRGFFAETAAPELLEALQQRPAAELFARMSRSGVVRFDDLRRFDGFADVSDASLRRFISVGDDSGDGALDAGEFAATVDAIAARADVGD